MVQVCNLSSAFLISTLQENAQTAASAGGQQNVGFIRFVGCSSSTHLLPSNLALPTQWCGINCWQAYINERSASHLLSGYNPRAIEDAYGEQGTFGGSEERRGRLELVEVGESDCDTGFGHG
jgi:hypothetical protein